MRACVHVIIYSDPRERYVGVDVFTSYAVALDCWKSELLRCQQTEDERGIVVLEKDEAGRGLFFRTGRGFECFYREEVLQNDAFELQDE